MPDTPATDPERGSTAPYIIICNGRIGVDAGDTQAAKIQAASQAAMNLVTYFDVKGAKIGPEDTTPISDLQHWLMDNVRSRKSKEVLAKIDELFALLDALEEKFS